MRERDGVFFVLASMRIRKWVCLSFFTEDETHTNLMLLGVVAGRKIKANPTIALVRAQRLTLPAPVSSTNVCNPPLKLCTAAALAVTAQRSAQTDCQMSECSPEWVILHQTM